MSVVVPQGVAGQHRHDLRECLLLTQSGHPEPIRPYCQITDLHQIGTSILPTGFRFEIEADINRRMLDVHFVPKADISSVWKIRPLGRCTSSLAANALERELTDWFDRYGLFNRLPNARVVRSSTRYGQNRHYLHRFAWEDCKVRVVFEKLCGGLVRFRSDDCEGSHVVAYVFDAALSD